MVGPQRFCTRCAHEWRPGARFCTSCGHPAVQDGPAADLPDRQEVPLADQGTVPPPVAARQEWSPSSSSAATAEQPTTAWTEQPPTTWTEQPPAAWAEQPPTVRAEQPPTAWAEQPPAAWAEQPPAASGALAGFIPPQASGYPSYVADDDAPGERPGRRSRWPLMLGIVALAAAGGTAAALYFTHSSHRSEPPSAGHLGASSAPASAPTPTPGLSSSPPPAAPTRVSVNGVSVDISGVSADADVAAVARTVGTYFGGIDARNYLQAWDAFAPALQAKIPYQPWSSSLGTTRDSRVAVQAIRHDPNGDIEITVSFRSHQAPQSGPNPGETCTNWSLKYRLVPSSGTASLPYLIRKVQKVGAGHVACGF